MSEINSSVANDSGMSYNQWTSRRYRAYSHESLIEIWPHLYRSKVIWFALFIHTLAALASLYASMLLDLSKSPEQLARLILIVSTITTIIMYLSSTISEWVCRLEENTVRKRLAYFPNINASLANIDLPISVATLRFYISLPAQIASILLYSCYVLYRSPTTLLCLIVFVALFAYPIYKFTLWRGMMIRVVRNCRNDLVDHHIRVPGPAHYCEIVDSFSYATVEFFWRNVQAIYVLRVAVFGFLLFALSFTTPKEHSFSILIALMLLITNGHLLVNSVCEFQEDKVSLHRIKSVMSNEMNAHGGKNGAPK